MGCRGDWDARLKVLVASFRELQLDLVAFAEAIVRDDLAAILPSRRTSAVDPSQPGQGRATSSDSALELVDELQSLSSNVVGESWIDDALDPSRLDIPRRLRFEIEDSLGRTQDGARLRMLGEGLCHRRGLRQKRSCSTAGPARSQLGEHLACVGRLPDEVEFVWVQEMQDEAGVLLHDVVPELGHLLPVQFRLPAAELLEPPGPPLGLMAGVDEE